MDKQQRKLERAFSPRQHKDAARRYHEFAENLSIAEGTFASLLPSEQRWLDRTLKDRFTGLEEEPVRAFFLALIEELEDVIEEIGWDPDVPERDEA